MKYRIVLLTLAPVLAWSAPFDGTWAIAQDSIKTVGKPFHFALVNGSFTCGYCTPTYTIKADGKDHTVADHAYYDTASVSVIDANTIEIKTRRGDKPFGERKLTVSADGNRLTDEWTRYDETTQHTGKDLFKRVEPAASGAALITGSWQPDDAASNTPADYLIFTYVETADSLKMSNPLKQSFEARFDGQQVLTEGDPGKTMVALKRVDARTIEETDRRNGKVTDIIVSKVSADGKTMRISDHDPLHGTTTMYTAAKQ